MESNSDNAWTDYIYADGQKIGAVASAEPLLHLHLNRSSANCNQTFVVGGVNLQGVPITTGDVFAMSVKASAGVQWGTGFLQMNGQGMEMPDQIGNDMAFLSLNDGLWRHEVGNLGAYAPSAIQQLQFAFQAGTQPGPADVWIKDVVISHSDGSLTPILTANQITVTPIEGTALSSSPQSVCAGSDLTLDYNPSPIASPEGANYYLADQVGTSQMELAAGGWPLWRGWFTPFGQEVVNGATQQVVGNVPADGTSNRYKFTGKERDAESGLDYFGARYYASNMGRWISPDWSAKEEPVPYAKLENPQSLNLYAYVQGKPETAIDPDGHFLQGPQRRHGTPMFETNQGDASSGYQQGQTAQGAYNQASSEAPQKSTPTATVSKVTYDPVKTPLGNGVVIVLAAKVSNASSYAQVNWVQTITLTQDGKSNTYVDGGGLYNTAKDMSDPDYQRVLKSQGADTIFADEPRRLAQDTTVTWHSDLQLVGVDASGGRTTLRTMSYGFSLAPSGAVTLEPLKGVQ